MNIIETRNLTYNLDNKKLFNNLNITIAKGSFVSIIGPNGVGKSTLLKLLSGQIITDNNIIIDNINVNKFSIEEINNRVSKISSFNEFFSKTVMEEILQDKKNISVFEINKVRKLLLEFDLLYLEKMSVQKLSYAENQIIALIKAIIKNPKIIVLDNAFSRLDIDKRIELFKYLYDYSKENNITIISTSNRIEDIKFSDRVLFLKNSSIFFDGTYKELLEDVDLNSEGYKNPWEIEVSNKLMMYDLIDSTFDNMDDIIGELCK